MRCGIGCMARTAARQWSRARAASGWSAWKGTGTPMLAGAARAIRSTATRTRRRRIPRIPSIPVWRAPPLLDARRFADQMKLLPRPLDALRHWLHGQNGGTAMVEAREGAAVGLECLEGDWDANACGCGACDTSTTTHAPPAGSRASLRYLGLARAAAAGRAPFRGSDEAPAPAADARQGLSAHGPAWLGADAMGGPAAAFRRAGAASGRCRRARTGADRDARSGWLGRDRGLPGRGGPRLNAACLRRVRRFGLPACRLVQAIPRLVLVHPTAAAYLDPDDGACRAGLGGAPFRDYRPTEERAMGTTMDKSVSVDMLAGRGRMEPARHRCADVLHERGLRVPDRGRTGAVGCASRGRRRARRGGLAELSGCAVAQRPSLGLRRAWRVGIDLHRHGGGRLAGRGRHGGRVHLQERQDPGQERLPQAAPGLAGARLGTAAPIPQGAQAWTLAWMRG